MVESLERRQLLAGDAMLPCEAYPSGSQGSEWADLDNLMISATPAATEALAEFTPLGFLPGATSSDPRGMSADGRYIVGVSGDQAYRWSRDQGMIDLGNFKADDVSHDGSVVVGGDGVSNGYRWENGTLSVVGDLTTIGRTEDDPGGTRMASVHRVSADGSVMVGNTAVIDGEADSFRLVGSEIQPLGDLPGGAHNSGARAVSADGSVVVGRGQSVNGDEAYRWENGEFTPLGDLLGGNFFSLAWTVSENGQFVVGQSESAAGIEAYLWSSETGMVGLGHLPGETADSRARGVSGDGSVVIGKANDDAFIWDSVNGMRNLQSVLINEYGMGDALAGWRLRRALAISEDGLIITGHGINPSGATESFMVDLDPSGNQAPFADAGADQSLNDAGGNGDEFVMLNGSGSDSDGEIASYEWKLGNTVIGTTASITPTLPVGTHTLTFTVTDNESASASDTVDITINEVPKKPVKVFLMAGHSNLLGTGYAANLDPAWNVPQDDVWIWLDHNMDGGQWTTVEPGHGRKTHAPHPSEPEGLEGPELRVGAELSLARTLADAYPDHQIALIKHGRGGAAIADHFNPENVGPADSMEHMWSGLTKKIDDSFAVLNAGGYSYEVAGMFMGIGGPDGLNRNFSSSDPNEVAAGEQEALARAAAYAENFTYFTQSIRDRYAVDMPFVSTLLDEEYSPGLLERFPGAPVVRQEQLQVDAADPRAAFFETTGLSMRDSVHFDAMGLIDLGTLFADNYLALVEPSIEPTIDYPDFSDSSTLNLVANAASPVGSENALQLTPLLTSQRGAAWHTSKQLVSLGFTMTFEFQAAGNGSDGFAFVIQNDSIDSIGGGGGGLGYKNLPNSLALEFDTFQNGTIDPNNNHVSVQTLGTNPNSNDTAISLGYVTPSFDINDGNVHQVKVVYQPGTLDVFLDDFSSPALSVPVDLATTLSLDAGQAWLGFTGASGGTAQQQDILNWSFSPLAAPQTTIVIDDAQVVEGDSGTTNLVFTVTRAGDTSGSSSVNWATSDGSATTADADYVADSGQVVFQEGETEKTISVTVNGDTDEEPHETLSVTLSAASGAELTDDLAIGTILNDDTTISTSDDVVTEGDTGIRFLGEFASATAARLHESRGLKFGPDGNLYVSRFDDPAVLRFDGQTGAPLGVFAAHPRLAAAKNLEFGPDGNLYVADNINQSVVRFSGTTGAFMDVFVSAGAGGLTTPRGLAFDDNGNLYVSSAGTSQILRFDGTTGTYLDAFVSAGSGGLISPTELIFGDDGHLYVASGAHQTDNSILRYDGDTGSFLGTFVAAGSAGLTIAPTGGIVFGQDVNGDGNSDLWVSNGDADEVLVFDGISGAYLATPVTAGLGGVDDPKGLAFDHDGNLLVVDNGNDRILRYGAASQAALTVSLSSPSAVAVSVDYDAADGTAMAGQDYTATSGTITFLPGETSKTIIVPTLDDDDAEPTESFTINLTGALGATIVDGIGAGEITDADVDQTAPIAQIVEVAPDPRNTSVGTVTIHFDESVTGVDITDFSLTRNGQAVDLSSLAVTQVTGQQYTIDLSTVTTLDGAYEFRLGSSGSNIQDGSGNALSTDAVDAFFIDFVAPQIDEFRINDGRAQRSMVRELTVTFSEQVSVDVNDFVVRNLSTDSTYTPLADVQVANGKTVVKLTFPSLTGGSLPDGDYTLTIGDTGVTDSVGNTLDGDQNGTAGGPAVFNFFRFFGDADGDRDVDVNDYVQFRRTYRRESGSVLFNDDFDFDGDGDVDARDYLSFRRNYRRVLPPH